jgi:ubiquitin C-terminal hydrolase
MCDRCETKTECVKGLRLGSLPDVLLLQLKRFDFDYTTMQRVKLNDFVCFERLACCKYCYCCLVAVVLVVLE